MNATPTGKKKTASPLVGSHMSIAGGVGNAIRHAEAAGCKCVQLFVKSSNQWRAKALTDEEATDFHNEQERTGIRPAIAHASYLLNCASNDKALLARSREAMVIELERCERLGIDGWVFHPGSPKDTPEAGIQRIAESIATAIDKIPDGKTRICLESTAGTGTHLGRTFEELAAIRDKVGAPDRVGVCLDTCHIFTAGYDIRTQAAYRKTMKQFDKIIGFDQLVAIHLNDSKYDFATRKDRHEHIGEGFIGPEAFGFIMRDRRLAKIPKILETPKNENYEHDKTNLALLRKLAAADN